MLSIDRVMTAMHHLDNSFQWKHAVNVKDLGLTCTLILIPATFLAKLRIQLHLNAMCKRGNS